MTKKFVRGQWVKHPHHGEAVFDGYLLDSDTECTIRVDGEEGPIETVEIENLEAVPWLGPSWSFSAQPSNPRHATIVVRQGTPGSRALCGTFTVDHPDATIFLRAVESLGAHVEDDRPEDRR